MQVTTGTAKRMKIKAPDIPNFRAVQDVAKMALFSILGEKVKDSVCLDIFAGSGNLGIEALSRGASWCDFVDENRKSVDTIIQNLEKCKLSEKAAVYRREAVKYAANAENMYDIIFADPFYNDTAHIFLMKNLEEILNENGVIAFFHGDNLDINKIIKQTSLIVVDERRFGKSHFTLLKKDIS